MEAKHEQLQQYKNEMHELKVKIDKLENELAAARKDEVVKVKVEELQAQNFEHFIEVTGNVEAEFDINVSPETSGVITQLLVKEGELSEKGRLLQS